VRWEPVRSGGYGTNSAHWRVELADGRAAFVKHALDAVSAGWLRDEHRIYSGVRGSFLPSLLGWHDGEQTLLVLEDLGDAEWPPPWSPVRIDAVLAALDEVHAAPPPDGLASAAQARGRLDGWPDVAADPEPLLSTGLASRGWLERALPALAQASAAAELAGSALLHLDVRSDNLCFRGGDVLFVDWNIACVGNPLLDVVAWLPSLRLEGGPEPWKLVADSCGLAPLVAGFFASRAGLPPPATAPTVREFQRRQAEVALAWAARELGLPPPGPS
jgi:aminoglycoside phosphotransferase (APT) family kinase protein